MADTVSFAVKPRDTEEVIVPRNDFALGGDDLQVSATTDDRVPLNDRATGQIPVRAADDGADAAFQIAQTMRPVVEAEENVLAACR